MKNMLAVFIWPLLIFILLPINIENVLAQKSICRVDLEVVADDGVVGDGGNGWGPHICRIVRTDDGVFTTYTSGDDNFLAREWHLMRRNENGWKEIARGKSGREPVNLLASPDGELQIIAYPDYQATLYSGKPQADSIQLRSQLIPVMKQTSHPYSAAAIAVDGNIYVLSCAGGEKAEPGIYRWALYHATDNQWQGRISQFDYRYCYTYIFPLMGGSIILVSSRDVTWEALGYQKPTGAFAYVFDAYAIWHSENFNRFLERMVFVNEIPTKKFPFVLCFVQNDAFFDHKNNIHILSVKLGETTHGALENYHSVYSTAGTLLHEKKLPLAVGQFCRIFQDDLRRTFIIGDTGFLGLLDAKGYSIKKFVMLDFQGYKVDYSGFFVTVPRSGSKLSRIVDFVFPSNEGRSWIYFSLDVRHLFPSI